LVVGLGAESVLETSLTLHRIYGYPIIPGSALKGLARTLALLELAAILGVPTLHLLEYWQRKPPDGKSQRKTPLNKLDDLLEVPLKTDNAGQQAALQLHLQGLQNDEALPDDATIKTLSLEKFSDHPAVRGFRVVFGFLGQVGGAVFFDGVPAKPPELVADVMNPHYPAYYRGEGFPHDADRPNPISFLVVAEGAIFGFAVAPRRRDNPADKNAVGRAKAWLAKALQEVGVGAKTGAGYGLFSTHKPIVPEPAGPEPRPPAPTPDRPKPQPEDVTSEDDEVSEFAKEFAHWLGTEE